jgi:tRNA threonylcarbamoyladenosine biosynthesis protein TsaE
VEFIIKSPQAMRSFGFNLAKACKKKSEEGIVIYLSGDLGAGKTMLVRGFLKAFDYNGKSKSPTFTIVEPYNLCNQTIYHFDLYRLNDPAELEYIGARDYFSSNAIVLIEWPLRAIEYLPTADLICTINFVHKKPQHRVLCLNANSVIGMKIKRIISENVSI